MARSGFSTRPNILTESKVKGNIKFTLFYAEYRYNSCMCNIGPMHYKLLNILFVISFSLLMIPSGLIKYNFTGLLNEEIICYFAYIVCAMGALLLFVKLKILFKRTSCKKANMYLAILFASLLLTILLPYQESGDFFSQLHLLFALLSFIVLHRILFEFKDFNRKITYFYLSCLLLSFMFVITFSSITGLSEYIFVMGLWISFQFL